MCVSPYFVYCSLFTLCHLCLTFKNNDSSEVEMLSRRKKRGRWFEKETSLEPAPSGVQSQPALGLWAWKSEPDKGRTPASLLPGCQLDAPLIGMENRREEQQKPIRLIAAVCRNNGIGKDGTLPWSLPWDRTEGAGSLHTFTCSPWLLIRSRWSWSQILILFVVLFW